jgi:hypothetical protein
LARPDLAPTEVARIYEMLAAMGTRDGITALLDRAEEKAAVTALARADAGALEWLIPELPEEDGPVTARQMAAYSGAAKACRLGAPKSREWWEKAAPEDRRKEAGRVTARAEAVLDYWRGAEGVAR